MMHQRGTTFFTDGTSGWTQQCAVAMDAAMPAAPQPNPAPNDSDEAYSDDTNLDSEIAEDENSDIDSELEDNTDGY